MNQKSQDSLSATGPLGSRKLALLTHPESSNVATSRPTSAAAVRKRMRGLITGSLPSSGEQRGRFTSAPTSRQYSTILQRAQRFVPTFPTSAKTTGNNTGYP